MAQRIKYDWLFIIDDKNLNREFREYKNSHPKVKSERRLGRSFVKSKHIKLWPCYIVGQTESFEDYASRILNVSWL